MKKITTPEKLALPLLLMASLFFHEAARAQNEKEITSQRLAWLRYDNRIRFNDKWLLETEIENKRYAFPDRQSEWVLPRMTLSRRLSSGWSAGTGFAYIGKSTPENAESRIGLVIPEIRPHQDLAYKHETGTSRFAIDHRYRLEERFVHKTSGNALSDGYNFNFRMRYRIQISIPLITKESGKGNLTARAFNELMLNFGKHIVHNSFDQNRLGAALNFGLRKDLQFQADFFNLFKERSSGDQYYNQWVARFTLYHNLHLTKKG